VLLIVIFRSDLELDHFRQGKRALSATIARLLQLEMKIAAEVWEFALRVSDLGNEGLHAIAADVYAAAFVAPDRPRSFDSGGLFSDGLGAAGTLDR
jgi:hypothetical protein